MTAFRNLVRFLFAFPLHVHAHVFLVRGGLCVFVVVACGGCGCGGSDKSARSPVTLELRFLGLGSRAADVGSSSGNAGSRRANAR